MFLCIIMTIGEFAHWLELRAPLRLQESYDNCGLLVGRRDRPLTGVLCCLDADEAVVQEAVSRGCNLVLSHHPVIFKGLKQITGGTVVERTVELAISSGVALYAGHTNWDSIKGGVSFSLAKRLGIRDAKIMMPRAGELLSWVLYVPSSHAELVEQAAYGAGAGRSGAYDECHFASPGTGTFRPLQGSNPYVGEQGVQSRSAELRLEFLVPKAAKEAVQKAVLQVHPYEVVAHSWIALENQWDGAGYGAVGNLPKPMELKDFLQVCAQNLGSDCIRYSRSDSSRILSRVAVCGGSGIDFISAAAASGADAYVTGDAKYHAFQDMPKDLVLIDVGHGESERPFIDDWAEAIRLEFTTFAVHISTTENHPVSTYKRHG